jgi:hypothetical protein
MALSVSHPVSTRDTNIISRADTGCDTERGISYYVYHIHLYLNMRKSCSVLRTFSHVINIILRGMPNVINQFIIYLVLNKGNLHI